MRQTDMETEGLLTVCGMVVLQHHVSGGVQHVMLESRLLQQTSPGPAGVHRGQCLGTTTTQTDTHALVRVERRACMGVWF